MSGFSNHPTVIRYRNCVELMDRMMERMGVDQGEAVRVDGGVAWLGARKNCFYCRDVEKCSNWLEGSAATPADFCRNSKFFRSCARPHDNPLAARENEDVLDALMFLDPKPRIAYDATMNDGVLSHWIDLRIGLS